MYYFRVLTECKDVRAQNREAFGLFKLGEGAQNLEQILEYGDEEEDD